MDKENKIIVFENRKIRRVWHNEEWWFVVNDIIELLTDSNDPAQYFKRLKQRDKELAKLMDKGRVQIVPPLMLEVETAGGRQKMYCWNTEGIFRIIQSIPSKKAEPFKRWLAKVGYERVQEIENPELAQERMKELYKKKGYSGDWIEKRVRGIAVRQELTDEWEQRGITRSLAFAILTNEISMATFGKTVGEYKEFKGLKRENLRDHMNDLELIFTMLGEASTTKIARKKDAQGFEENKRAAKEGGTVAGIARRELEIRSGESVVASDNYLEEPERVKRLGKKRDEIDDKS